MNKTQEKKLKVLKETAVNAEIPVADASNALKDAKSDEDKAAAQALLDEATAARDAAKQAVEDFIAENDKDADQAASKKSGSMVTVIASDDRYRIGRFFPKKAAIEIPVEDLSKEQIKALQADPVLVVTGA